MPESFYSDEALRKRAEIAAWPADSAPPLTLLVGLLEPRTPPADHERCVYCGSDARDEAGGEHRGDGRYCGLCISRERDVLGL